MKLVNEVYAACNKPIDKKPPAGCYLDDNCDCAFANGTVLTYEQWNAVYAKEDKVTNQRIFIVLLLVLVVGFIAYRRYKSKIRIQKL